MHLQFVYVENYIVLELKKLALVHGVAMKVLMVPEKVDLM
jgi:hypothetical protein